MVGETKALSALAFGAVVFALAIVLTARAAADDTLRLGAVYSQHQANAEYITKQRDERRRVEQEQYDRFMKTHGFSPETRGYQFK